jgi:hypothetical protein
MRRVILAYAIAELYNFGALVCGSIAHKDATARCMRMGTMVGDGRNDDATALFGMILGAYLWPVWMLAPACWLVPLLERINARRR